MNDINLLKPIAIFEQLFERKIRLEDRDNLTHAPFRIAKNVLPSCCGSSFVKIGNTEVLCGVKVRVLPEVVDAGQVVCNVELNDLANRDIHHGPLATKAAQGLSSQLQRLVETIICPDAFKQLNIYTETDKHQAVASYILKLDIIVTVDDGCLFDACLPAAVIALSSARWPRLVANTTNQSSVSSWIENYRQCSPVEMVSLLLAELPVTISMSFVPISTVSKSDAPMYPVIVQPTRRETTLWDTDAGPMQMTLNASGKIFDICMVNAFCAGLHECLRSTKLEKDSQPHLWNILMNKATDYASEMQDAYNNALNKTVI